MSAIVPEGRELMREFRRLRWRDQSRLTRMARRGEVASEPQEAALVAGLARSWLRAARWWVPLCVAVILMEAGFVAYYVLVGRLSDLYLRIPLTLIIAASLWWYLMKMRPHLPETERANRELAEGGPAKA
jgi:hypothetical protein